MLLYYVISITDHDRGDIMAGIYESAGLHMTLSKSGKGTARKEHLALYGLEEKEKTIISAVAGSEEERALMKLAKRKLFIDVPGHGIIMSIPIKSVAGKKTLAYLSDSRETGGKPDMNFEYELIIVILNEGYSDMVMDAARAAGAQGGTVIHAKKSGAHRAEKFFGVSLADEKDMIYIAVGSDEKAAIMRSISEKAGPGSPAGAICFSLPISSVAGMRTAEDN